jgi:hypothetical protein
MNIVKKILNAIANPFNSISLGKVTDKLVNLFTKHPILIFVVSLVVSAMIFIVYHANELF